MENISIREAGMKDIEFLTRLRIEVLRAANQLTDTEPMEHIEEATRKYLEKSMKDHTCVTYLAYLGNIVVGCGSVVRLTVLPTFSNSSGKKSYIMNMYTKPDFRKKGIGKRILDRIVTKELEEFSECVSLESTTMGRPLYLSYGFSPMNDEMEYRRN